MDEDPTVLESAGRILRAQGFATATAFDGPGAIQVHACLGPFTLLIAAIDMPEMDGPELAQQLRQLQPELKVVYLTSPAGDRTADDDASGGLDRSWAKGSETFDGLSEIVASLLVPSTPEDPAQRHLRA